MSNLAYYPCTDYCQESTLLINTKICQIIYYMYKNVHRWLYPNTDNRVLPHRFRSIYGYITPIDIWHKYGDDIIEEFLLHCKCYDIDDFYISSELIIQQCRLDIFKRFEKYLHQLLQLRPDIDILNLYKELIDNFKAIVNRILNSYRFYIQEIF